MCAKLLKEEMKARAVKIVVGRGRSPDDSWRSGKPPVPGFKGENEDIHEAKLGPRGARGQLRRLRHAPASLGDGAIRVRAPVR